MQEVALFALPHLGEGSSKGSSKGSGEGSSKGRSKGGIEQYWEEVRNVFFEEELQQIVSCLRYGAMYRTDEAIVTMGAVVGVFTYPSSYTCIFALFSTDF